MAGDGVAGEDREEHRLLGLAVDPELLVRPHRRRSQRLGEPAPEHRVPAPASAQDNLVHPAARIEELAVCAGDCLDGEPRRRRDDQASR